MPIRPENRDRYPADWPQISRRIRFGRAQGRCECHGECRRGTHRGRCPNRHGREAYGTGSMVVLTVAHLNHTPEDCRDTNLRAMCQGCHLHYDRDHHRQTAAATRRAAVEGAGQLALVDLAEFEDDEELIEALYGPQPEPCPLAGYARPATRPPFEVDPLRPVVSLPPLDDYTPPARTTVRNR